jgi:hypothetical protein
MMRQRILNLTPEEGAVSHRNQTKPLRRGLCLPFQEANHQGVGKSLKYVVTFPY